MKTKEELQADYKQLCLQLGELEYDFALKKNYVLVQLDAINREYNELMKLEKQAEVDAEEIPPVPTK